MLILLEHRDLGGKSWRSPMELGTIVMDAGPSFDSSSDRIRDI